MRGRKAPPRGIVAAGETFPANRTERRADSLRAFDRRRIARISFELIVLLVALVFAGADNLGNRDARGSLARALVTEPALAAWRTQLLKEASVSDADVWARVADALLSAGQVHESVVAYSIVARLSPIDPATAGE